MNKNAIPQQITSSALCRSPQTQVETQSDNISNAIGRLNDICSQLNGRLAGVLRQNAGDESIQSPPEAVICPHADMLRSQANQLNSIADTLVDIVGRIEL